jgi:hypothetical protein
LNVIELKSWLDSDTQEIFHFVFWHVSELSFSVNGWTLLVEIEFFDFLEILKVHGEPVKFVELSLILFVVLLSVCFELCVLVNDGALSKKNNG